MRSFASHPDGRRAKPLLGVRRQPGRLALAVFRLPLPLYRRGWGWLLGHTFLLLVHAGRKTGKLHSTVAMALRYDPETHEAVICSVWGQNTDWVRNIRVRPAMQKSRSAGSRSHPSSASSRRARASQWRSSSDAGIPWRLRLLHVDPGLGRSPLRYGPERLRPQSAVRVIESTGLLPALRSFALRPVLNVRARAGREGCGDPYSDDDVTRLLAAAQWLS